MSSHGAIASDDSIHDLSQAWLVDVLVECIPEKAAMQHVSQQINAAARRAEGEQLEVEPTLNQ